MSVLSPTRLLTVKITQYVLSPHLHFNLNQTVIRLEKVTVTRSVFIQKFQTVVPSHGFSRAAGFVSEL
jgi:hypothetical protein